MSAYVPASLRRQVIERAGDRCEYCRFPQGLTLLVEEGDSVLPVPAFIPDLRLTVGDLFGWLQLKP